MKTIYSKILILVFCAIAHAQGNLNTPIQFVDTLPSTCSPSKNETVIAYLSKAPFGLYYCSSEGKWSIVRTINFNSVSGKLAANKNIPANVATDVFSLALIPSESGGVWDIDAKIQLETTAINLFQSCQVDLIVRDANNVLLEKVDTAISNKGAILTFKNQTPISLGGIYSHAQNAPVNAFLQINCTSAQIVTLGTWITAEYRK